LSVGFLFQEICVHVTSDQNDKRVTEIVSHFHKAIAKITYA